MRYQLSEAAAPWTFGVFFVAKLNGKTIGEYRTLKGAEKGMFKFLEGSSKVFTDDDLFEIVKFMGK